MKDEIMVCSVCYSDDIQELVQGWWDVNSDDEYSYDVDRSGNYRCNGDCDDYCEIIPLSQVPESHYRKEKIERITNNIVNKIPQGKGVSK